MKKKLIFLGIVISVFFNCKKTQESNTVTSNMDQEKGIEIPKDTLFYLYETTALSKDEKDINMNVIYRFVIEKKDTLNRKDKIEGLNTSIIKPTVTDYLKSLIQDRKKSELKNLKNEVNIPDVNALLSDHNIEIIKLVPTIKNKELISI